MKQQCVSYGVREGTPNSKGRKGDRSHQGVILGYFLAIFPKVIALLCFWTPKSPISSLLQFSWDLDMESVARSPDVLLAGPGFILHVRLTGVTVGQSSWKRMATLNGPGRPLCEALDNEFELADLSSPLHNACGGRFPALQEFSSDLQVGLRWRCPRTLEKGGDPEASCI